MKFKRCVVYIFSLLLLSTVLAGCINPNKILSVRSKNKLLRNNKISSVKVHNAGLEYKEVKSISDINDIIILINSINIIQSDIGSLYGDGYGVQITYDDGTIDNFTFYAGSKSSRIIMFYNGKDYIVDKDISKHFIDLYKSY